MSQYKISKKRLAQIIKEEYQSLHEPNPLRGDERSDQLDAILSSTGSDIGNLHDVISYFVTKAADADVTGWLDERGLMGGPGASAYNRKDEAAKPDFADLNDNGDKEEPMKKAAKEKNLKKESLDSIRDLIQQELQSL